MYYVKFDLMIEDHPRSCGKDSISDIVTRVGPGSPPLVRERHIARQRKRKLGGITPARAGKTFNKFTTIVICWDHPRSCGKDTLVSDTAFKFSGSPPLVRERLDNISVMTSSTGITPARAGKTAMAGLPVQAAGDHPRSCGKDSIGWDSASFKAGSPPLVRERRGAMPGSQSIAGITPARAGKTMNSTWMTMKLQDHPRSCGKDYEQHMDDDEITGSPPLVRERPLCFPFLPFFAGITPARAGKTG